MTDRQSRTVTAAGVEAKMLRLASRVSYIRFRSLFRPSLDGRLMRSPHGMFFVAAILAGCATGSSGASARAGASVTAVAQAAEQIMRFYNVPVERPLGLAGQGRVRTLLFRPHEIWSAENVGARVMCQAADDAWSAPVADTQLRVTITIREERRRPARPASPPLPISSISVSSGGRYVDQGGQCRITDDFAGEIASGIVSRVGSLRAGSDRPDRPDE